MNNMPIIIVILTGLCFLSICDKPPPTTSGSNLPPTTNLSGCRAEHVVGNGETQWTVAARYAGSQDKHLWLRKMRRASYLATDDDHLYPGQVLCVGW
jgi:hypothetical protein